MAADLLVVRQHRGEPLLEFVKHFRDEALQIPYLEATGDVNALTQGMRDVLLQHVIGVQQLVTLVELLFLAQCHAIYESQLVVNRRELDERPEKKRQPKHAQGWDHKRKRWQDNSSPQRSSDSDHYTPLTASPEQILMKIQDKEILRWPEENELSFAEERLQQILSLPP